MNCKICGAELKKTGDLCNNCINKLRLEKASKEDTTEVLKVKRKFAIGYEILSHIETIGIVIFMIAILISIGGDYTRIGFTAIPFFLFCGIIFLLYEKYRISSSELSFYSTKLIYKYKKIRKKTMTINYRDIKDISYEETPISKVFKFGNIIIKTNKGNILKRNIIIDSVANIEETMLKIQKIMK
ncbi:MAG: PH domain-containing protein [Clostridia bacterium]|nr:PH domain-containing protein [Clostridia bacterium]